MNMDATMITAIQVKNEGRRRDDTTRSPTTRPRSGTSEIELLDMATNCHKVPRTHRLAQTWSVRLTTGAHPRPLILLRPGRRVQRLLAIVVICCATDLAHSSASAG